MSRKMSLSFVMIWIFIMVSTFFVGLYCAKMQNLAINTTINFNPNGVSGSFRANVSGLVDGDNKVPNEFVITNFSETSEIGTWNLGTTNVTKDEYGIPNDIIYNIELTNTTAGYAMDVAIDNFNLGNNSNLELKSVEYSLDGTNFTPIEVSENAYTFRISAPVGEDNTIANVKITLNVKNIMVAISNLDISYDLKMTKYLPYTILTYGEANTKFAGYKYLKFASNPSDTWIIIGAGENLQGNMLKAGATCLSNDNITLMNAELANNQLLLMRDTPLTNQKYMANNDGAVTYSTSVLKSNLESIYTSKYFGEDIENVSITSYNIYAEASDNTSCHIFAMASSSDCSQNFAISTYLTTGNSASQATFSSAHWLRTGGLINSAYGCYMHTDGTVKETFGDGAKSVIPCMILNY